MGLEETPVALKQILVNNLRANDEAVVLPQAHRSSESGGLKNVAIRFNGDDHGVAPDLFGPGWFTGLSIVAVPAEMARPLVANAERCRAALHQLANVVASETASAEAQVGPELEADSNDRDVRDWDAGFDGPGCCVGLYTAQQSLPPEPGMEGFHRAHESFFLVCKAGGGVAAQTFHTRFTTALANGASLEECFGEDGSPGAQALRRVSMAAQRNRARILVAAAEAFGFDALDTISDNAAPEGSYYRAAMPQVTVHTNAIRKMEGFQHATYQYSSGCVDASISQGLASCSCPCDGVVLVSSSNGDYRVNLRNDAYSCLPFASHRLTSNSHAVTRAAGAHKKSKQTKDTNETTNAHPDHEWVRSHFAWKQGEFGIDLEPPSLWGTYAPETFVSSWSRELGIAECRVTRLRPELVVVAGTEPPKLRAAARHVNG